MKTMREKHCTKALIYLVILALMIGMPMRTIGWSASVVVPDVQVMDLGKVVIETAEEADSFHLGMLRDGRVGVFTATLESGALTGSNIRESHDRASKLNDDGLTYFRLWYFKEDLKPVFHYYVGKADKVFQNQKSFDAFLAANKGKVFKSFSIKLNDFSDNGNYRYPKNFGFKGDYVIKDEWIGGGAVLRTVKPSYSWTAVSSKTYQVKNYTEFREAFKEAFVNQYSKIIIETPKKDDKTYDVDKAYKEIQNLVPQFELHRTLFTSSAQSTETKRSNGKTVTRSFGKYVIAIDYDFDAATMKSLYNQSLAKVKSVVKSLVTDQMTSYEKMVVLHDYLVNNVTYDHDTFNFKLDDSTIHTVVGAMLKNKAVCDGYAWTYKLMLDEIGIENRLISGKGISEEGEEPVSHAWNLVKLDNQYYHVDVTYDDHDDSSRPPQYPYFLISDQAAAKTHIWTKSSYPEAKDDSLSYYRVNGFYGESHEQFLQLLEQQLSENKEWMYFEIPGFDDSWLNQSFTDTVFKVKSEWNSYKVVYYISGDVVSMQLKP